MLKNGQTYFKILRCSHRKIFKVCLAIFQHYEIKSNLLDKHLSQNHRLHMIFNRNNVKVSYSCTKSIKTVNNHNKNILGKKPPINTSNCSFRNKESWPLNGQWQIGEVVYEGTPFQVTNQIIKKVLELRKNLSKDNHNHNLSFRNEFYKNDTELSKELWQIKMKNYIPEITWRSIKKCLPYNYNTRKCYLCLNEKLEIL